MSGEPAPGGHRTSAEAAALFGRGLRLDDGDLIMNSGRLAEVSGPANLVQGLVTRLATPLGSDRLDTTYGLDVGEALTGPLSRRMAQEVLRLTIIRTLAADPRVTEVVEVVFDDEPAYLARHPEAAGPARRSRRSAVVEVTVQPVATPARPGDPARLTASALAAGGAAPITLLTDVSW